jgi:hypothetical protein
VVITERGKDEVKDQYILKGKKETIQNSSRHKFNLADKDKAAEILSQREAVPNGAELEDDDGICTICFTEQANTVLLDCGHGGICLNCAIDSMKKNNHCLFCRAKVVQIIEINTSEIRKGLYKVVNSYYVSDDS